MAMKEHIVIIKMYKIEIKKLIKGSTLILSTLSFVARVKLNIIVCKIDANKNAFRYY